MAEAQNPFADPLRFERRVPECAIVIFGASGDLTKRKLIPALFQLALDRKLPASFAIIGNSRTPLTDEAFREKMAGEVKEFLESGDFDDEQWARFAANLYYVAGNMNDPALYQAIEAKLAATGQRNILYYLSTQPSYYGTVAAGLVVLGLLAIKRGTVPPGAASAPPPEAMVLPPRQDRAIVTFSNRSWPTSPTHRSPVLGSKLKRHGMRKPDAQISGRTGAADFRYGFDSGIA